MIDTLKIKLKRSRLITISLIVLIAGLAAVPANADTRSVKNISTKQIIIDTGSGGGDGASLPDVKWILKQTPNGKPFIFWSWDPTS